MTDEKDSIFSENMGLVKKKARSFFGEAGASHGWDHTLRVSVLARRIGEIEGADMSVVMAAAFLHDIGRAMQDESGGRLCHARKGSEMAGPLVAELSLEQSQKENIIHCIRSHRFRKGDEPATLEAKVLFDADKLDSIGAIGVARAFAFAGEVGARLHCPDKDPFETLAYSEDDTGYREFKVKLEKVKDRMLTDEGRRMAVNRHSFMSAFFKRFLDEYEGLS